MRNILSTLVIASLMVIFSDAQTFQYSRGWTNGKRTAPTEPLALANSVLLPSHFPSSSGIDKPSDKLLLQRLLKSPCDVRLVAALVARNKDLLQQILAASDLELSGSGGLFDGANGALDGSTASDEGRYKRDTRGRY
uniref:Pro-corazonin n=1 Tax=Culex pipiens TaxID=7175 RepID=A0A8D8H5F1_CULPI